MGLTLPLKEENNFCSNKPPFFKNGSPPPRPVLFFLAMTLQIAMKNFGNGNVISAGCCLLRWSFFTAQTAWAVFDCLCCSNPTPLWAEVRSLIFHLVSRVTSFRSKQCLGEKKKRNLV